MAKFELDTIYEESNSWNDLQIFKNQKSEKIENVY